MILPNKFFMQLTSNLFTRFYDKALVMNLFIVKAIYPVLIV